MAEQKSSFKETAKAFISGTIGGWGQVLSGQPFDTVKVRMQTSPLGTYSSTMDCVKKTYQNEGLMAFYKGSTAPLVGVGVCVALQFTGYEMMRSYFVRQKAAETGVYDSEAPLHLWQYALCGACGGVFNTPAISPVEHIRTRLQVQYGTGAKYKGAMDAVRQIYNSHGIRGIMKGTAVTALRDTPGYAGYFVTYNIVVRDVFGSTPGELSPLLVMLSGALAGFGLWIPMFPVDMIKSKLQTDSWSNPKYNGAVDCFKKTIAEEGIRGLYRGFTPCVARAMPVNATIFLFYEVSKTLLGRD